jgi:hypothetical protein
MIQKKAWGRTSKPNSIGDVGLQGVGTLFPEPIIELASVELVAACIAIGQA